MGELTEFTSHLARIIQQNYFLIHVGGLIICVLNRFFSAI